MAKGRRRSNREIRKPKKERPPPKTESSFSKQISTAAVAGSSRAKGKG
jgi:hypothetical protein